MSDMLAFKLVVWKLEIGTRGNRLRISFLCAKSLFRYDTYIINTPCETSQVGSYSSESSYCLWFAFISLWSNQISS